MRIYIIILVSCILAVLFWATNAESRKITYVKVCDSKGCRTGLLSEWENQIGKESTDYIANGKTYMVNLRQLGDYGVKGDTLTIIID